ncbi:Clr5 domain-containing protein [Coniochaeta sp. 2T2.1]|nr:Clr5 domain-containing protein [Coniochaeta sp. 2T2.1]
MSITPPTRKQWATAEDWERLKPLIKKLYKDELKPLKEVIAILEKEHNFHATARMYKSKLGEWGLAKYIRATEAVAIIKAMEARQAAGKSSQIILRGEKVDLDRIKNYIRRNRNRGRLERMLVQEKVVLEEVERELVCRTPSPSPDMRSPTPGYTGPAEDLFRSIAIYIDGSLAAGHWFLHGDGIMRSSKGAPEWYNTHFKDFWNRLDMAMQLVGKVKRLDLVKLLEPAFGLMVPVVHQSFPRALPFLLSSFEMLYDRGLGDLAIMFARHLAGLSEVIWGHRHPYTRIWQQLTIIYEEDHAEITERLFLALLDEFRKQRLRSEWVEIGIYNDYFDCVMEKRDPETQLLSLSAEVARMKARKAKTKPASLLMLRYAVVVKDLALQQERYADAAVAMDCLLDHGDWDGAFGLQARAEAAVAAEDYEAAERFYREATEHVDINTEFKDEMWASRMLTELESVLMRNGKLCEADIVAQARLDRMAMLESGTGHKHFRSKSAPVLGDKR